MNPHGPSIESMADAGQGGDASGAFAALAHAASECLPVLPVAVTQLEEIGADLAASVDGLCASFLDMSERAQVTVRKTREVLSRDSATENGVDVLIETSQQSLQRLMQRLLHASETSMRAVYRIRDLQAGMGRITETLVTVEEIAMRARLLSVNAKLEAARLSGQGKAFGVVASEISDVARLCASMGESINVTVRQMQADVEATVKDLCTLASDDVTEILAGREAVNDALDNIKSVHVEMEMAVRAVSSASESLAEDVANAVVHMQFQDRVSQRMGHVVDALRDLHAELAGALKDVPPTLVAGKGGRLVQQVAERYTMSAERQAHHGDGRAPGAAPAPAATTGGSVELF